MVSTVLKMIIIVLISSLTSAVSPTNGQQNHFFAPYLPFNRDAGHTFINHASPVSALLLPPSTATGLQSITSDGHLQSKGLGLVDLVLLSNLISRISQFEEKLSTFEATVSDGKSSPVCFTAYNNTPFVNSGDQIVFTDLFTNVGGGMDVTNGYFTAPVDGTYFFAFKGVAEFPVATASHPYLIVSFDHNDVAIAYDKVLERAPYGGTLQECMSMTMTLTLSKGDTIKVIAREFTQDTKLGTQSTTFTGILLF